MSEKPLPFISADEKDQPFPAVTSRVLDIDAQTLYFFLTLFRTRSVGEAAQQMHVSLSSANRMLARLRTYWNDPLFIRTGFSMMPTAGARGRYDRVLGLMTALESLQSDTAADARTLRRTVRIATYDSAFALGIAAVFSELTSALPCVVFQAVQADEHLFGDLREDRLDMAFFARQGLQPGLHSMAILTTPYVCVVRAGHPLEAVAAAAGRLDREDLAEWRQVMVNAQPDRHRAPNSPANGWFNPPSPEGIAVVLPFFLAVPLCLEETDFYSVVPEATARAAFDADKFRFLPLSEAAPALTVNLGWHERTHAYPGFQLIRSVLKTLIAARMGKILNRA